MSRLVDGDPQDAHPLSCAIWTSPEPAEDCSCGSFEYGVERLVALFESYAQPADESGRAAS